MKVQTMKSSARRSVRKYDVIMTYHSLLASLFAVSTLYIEYENVSRIVMSHPNALGRLGPSRFVVHYVKASVKEQIKECAFFRLKND